MGGAPNRAGTSRERAGSLRRAARLLRAIGRCGAAGASLMEIVAWTGLPRATIHRVLPDLAALGWVERDPASRAWHLGGEVWCLGLTAALRHPIARIAETEVAVMVARTELAGFVVVRTGNDALCVLRHERDPGRLPLVMHVGGRASLGLGAGGMALIAGLPQAEGDAVVAANRLRYRRMERYDEKRFRAALAEARRTGLARHVDLFLPGFTGLGVALPGPGGHPLGALSVAVASAALGPADAARAEAELRQRRARPGGRGAGGGRAAPRRWRDRRDAGGGLSRAQAAFRRPRTSFS